MATYSLKAGRSLRRAVAAFGRFHVRYRWAFLLVVVGGSMVVLFGSAELAKALFGLGFEQVLLHLGEWAKGAEATAEAAESVT